MAQWLREEQRRALADLRGPMFDSQPLPGGSQPSVTPVPGNLTPLLVSKVLTFGLLLCIVMLSVGPRQESLHVDPSDTI